jgi:hypothetical protein
VSLSRIFECAHACVDTMPFTALGSSTHCIGTVCMKGGGGGVLSCPALEQVGPEWQQGTHDHHCTLNGVPCCMYGQHAVRMWLTAVCSLNSPTTLLQVVPTAVPTFYFAHCA